MGAPVGLGSDLMARIGRKNRSQEAVAGIDHKKRLQKAVARSAGGKNGVSVSACPIYYSGIFRSKKILIDWIPLDFMYPLRFLPCLGCVFA
jgi:hypothetical protein